MFLPCVMGWGQIAIIALIVILLFGGAKIPELMRGMGRGVKEFKDAVNKDYSAANDTKEEPKKPADNQ